MVGNKVSVVFSAGGELLGAGMSIRSIVRSNKKDKVKDIDKTGIFVQYFI